MKTGLGFDAHAFVAGRALVLGGTEIAHDRGLEGHSDGDVLTHAIIDALLGAAGLGDIGEAFPSSDETLRVISSIELLRRAGAMLSEAGLRATSVDAVVIAEAPPIAPHRDAIRKVLADAIPIDAAALSVKGTTTDGMGFTGRGEGIAAIAVATVDVAG